MVFQFDWNGQTVTIDLSPYHDNPETLLGATELHDRAVHLCGQLAVLQGDIGRMHAAMKKEALMRADQELQAAGTKITDKARELIMHADTGYQTTRRIRDFVDSAWSYLKDVVIHKLRAREKRLGEMVPLQRPQEYPTNPAGTNDPTVGPPGSGGPIQYAHPQGTVPG